MLPICSASIVMSKTTATVSGVALPCASATVTVAPTSAFAAFSTAILPGPRSSNEPCATSSLEIDCSAAMSPLEIADGLPSMVTDSRWNGTTCWTPGTCSTLCTSCGSTVPPVLSMT